MSSREKIRERGRELGWLVDYEVKEWMRLKHPELPTYAVLVYFRSDDTVRSARMVRYMPSPSENLLMPIRGGVNKIIEAMESA